MNHDEEWLDKESDHDPVKAIFAVRYFEHMEAKKTKADDELHANFPEILCVNCNYTFKGYLPCKCHMRITAEMRDAILSKEQSKGQQ